MKRTIDVCIGNYGYCSEGELHDAWISLPCSNAEIWAFLKAHRLWDPEHEEIYVSDYDGVPFGLTGLFGEWTRLDDLNMLARQMQKKPYECKVVSEYLETTGETPESVIELMNMIEQSDDLGFYYYDNFGATSEECIALDMLSATGTLQKLEDSGLLDYFDLEKYGRDLGFDYFLGKNGYVDSSYGFTPDRYSREELEAMYGGECETVTAKAA